MKKLSLLTTNSYLKDYHRRKKLLCQTVLTSSAIEGIHRAVVRALTPKDPEGTSNYSSVLSNGAQIT